MTIIEQLAQEPLPAGWYRKPIVDLALRCKLGDERVTEDLASEDSFHEGMIALIVSGDLNGTKEVPVNKYITLEALKEKARQVVQKNAQKKKKGRKQDIELVSPQEGTVLLTVARQKAGVVGMLNVERAVFNHAVYAMTPDPAELYSDWLFYYFKNPRIRHIISSDFMSGRAPYANVALIQKLEVPIPPKPQQAQLLTRIEALLPNVQKAQKLLSENLARIHQLLTNTLQEIFVSSRIAQWDHAPLDALVTINLPLQPLDQSLHEYEQPSIEADTIHPTIACAVIDRTRTANTTSHTTFSPLSKNPDVIVYSNLYNKAHWQTRVAMPYADSDTFLLSNILGFKYSSDLFQILVSDTTRLQPRFLFWSLLAPHFTQIMRGNSPPSKLIISIDKLRSYELSFPDITEQERISTYLDAVLEKVRQMESKQTASLQAIESMEESILNQAFAGKL